MNFPKSKQYDEAWVSQNLMGPNAMWIAELLAEKLKLEPGMKILDLGCGTALTSIFLAQEYGVTVFASDLWIAPTENLERIKTMHLEDKVFPIKVEAHALPFADEFFDAVVSVDAYHYFGTDDNYLPSYLVKMVKQGGQLGIAVPGLAREFDGGVPDRLKPYWSPEMYTFHSPAWWRKLWEKTGLVDIGYCGEITESAVIWESWFNCGNPYGIEDRKLIEADVDRYITLMMMTAVKR